jgi:hypothetical protein
VLALEIRIISTEDISDFIYQKLIQQGYAPKEEECEDLADIMFDYLIELGIVEDFEEY